MVESVKFNHRPLLNRLWRTCPLTLLHHIAAGYFRHSEQGFSIEALSILTYTNTNKHCSVFVYSSVHNATESHSATAASGTMGTYAIIHKPPSQPSDNVSDLCFQHAASLLESII